MKILRKFLFFLPREGVGVKGGIGSGKGLGRKQLKIGKGRRVEGEGKGKSCKGERRGRDKKEWKGAVKGRIGGYRWEWDGSEWREEKRGKRDSLIRFLTSFLYRTVPLGHMTYSMSRMYPIMISFVNSQRYSAKKIILRYGIQSRIITINGNIFLLWERRFLSIATFLIKILA